ncbi:hypothetical protein AAC387_Pa02g1851 [Persea americana]
MMRLPIRVERESADPSSSNKKLDFRASINPWKLMRLSKEKALMAAEKARERIAKRAPMAESEPSKHWNHCHQKPNSSPSCLSLFTHSGFHFRNPNPRKDMKERSPEEMKKSGGEDEACQLADLDVNGCLDTNLQKFAGGHVEVDSGNVGVAPLKPLPVSTNSISPVKTGATCKHPSRDMCLAKLNEPGMISHVDADWIDNLELS